MKRISDMHMRILEKETIECRDVEDLLGDYIDQELSATLKARLATHIRYCRHCQSEEKAYRLVIELAQELPPIPVSVEVKNRLRKALNEKLGISLPMVSEG